MSIAVLNQVYTEARRLAIAGSHLSVGDFRLKRLIEPLEKSAQKAPVFGSIAKAIDKLVSGSERESAQSLLDLASLVLAVLYTQGQSNVDGQPRAIESKELTLVTTQMPARLLKPLIEALTSTGSGRLETIKEGFERGAFDDIRLVNPAIRALDDSYSEIADFVTDNVLPKYGAAILSEIRNNIDIKGRAGNVRRLRLLHTLDPAGARPLVLEAFESGSKEMRIAALGCLGDSPEDLPHLLEQAEAKSKDVRRVALSRLGNFLDDTTIDILSKALSGADRELVVPAIANSSSATLWQRVLDTTARELEKLFVEKDKAKLGKALERFDQLIGCYRGRTDALSLQQLAAIHDRRAELIKLKATPVSGLDVLASLSATMLGTGDAELLGRLVDDRENMLDERFYCSAAAGLLTLSPTEFYEAYSPYFIQKPSKAKSGRREGPREALLALLPDENGTRGWYYFHRYGQMPETLVETMRQKTWDPRWLDASIAADELGAAIGLGQASHAGLKSYLLGRFQSSMKKKDIDYDLYWTLKGIVNFAWPEATECWLQVLRKQVKQQTRYYSAYFLAPLVSKLPKASAELVEQALAGMPDAIIDEIMPHLQALKASQ